MVFANNLFRNQTFHRFWDTQPVPRPGINTNNDDKSNSNEIIDYSKYVGPIDTLKTPDDVRKEPYPLPKGFGWCVVDLNDPAQLKSTYTLLSENYVEDDENMFRFDYSPEFLQWALQPPGYFPEWIVGLEAVESKRLLALITGIPTRMNVLGKSIKMAEINFLCVSKKLRAKRLAPVLIKEITRRVNLTDQWQAIYTAGVNIPEPIGCSKYYHRSLNPKKLIDVNFSVLQPRMTMARTKRLYAVPETPKLPFVPMELRHCKSVHKLLSNYLKKFKVHIEMNIDEVAHCFLGREDVVYSYVIENRENPDNATDLCSFYNLPSLIIGNTEYSHVKAAYSFYNIATTVPFCDIIADALVFAKQNDFDVFNMLNLMGNASVFTKLKFGEGDGRLHYYLYNYSIGQKLNADDIGIVLV